MNGFVVCDKPSGITSHDLVDRVRRVLGERRVGHAGTLDPAATGVLLVGVGRGARLLRFLEVHDKEYVAVVRLGVTTSTLDAEGAVTAERDASGIAEDDVERALGAFRGEIDQVPPMVSAIKVGGEALYRKARRGEEVERAPRTVVVHEATLESFTAPDARIRIRCSKGTYVRVLAADLGEALGVGAHLHALRRTAVGPFTEADATPLDAVDLRAVRPMADAVRGYPRRSVDETAAREIAQGRTLPAAGIAGPYAVVGPAGLVAMAEDRGEGARPLCVVWEP